MTAVALDSSAVITWVLQEPGWVTVDRILDMAEPAFLPGAALTEVIYRARARGNRGSSGQILATLLAKGCAVEPAGTADLVRAAELYELSAANPGPPDPRTGMQGTLSLGDALIVAVVERLNCPVVTRDGLWSWLAAQGLTSAAVRTF